MRSSGLIHGAIILTRGQRACSLMQLPILKVRRIMLGKKSRTRRSHRLSMQPGTKYPATFSEVMQMVQRGETPAGVKDIPNTLSKDAGNSTIVNNAVRPSNTKPWERAAAVNSNPAHVPATPFIEEITDSDDGVAPGA